jgi:hypothetical protein
MKKNFCGVVADGPAKHGVGGLDGVEDGTLGDRPFDLDAHLALDPGQHAKVRGEEDPDGHAMVWASTERTAGRSRTMGDQLSPASREA